jgi:hypothetical protein
MPPSADVAASIFIRFLEVRYQAIPDCGDFSASDN